MDELWQVLIQFVFRLTFGVAWAMVAVSPRWVNSGFYRNHLWVLMGLNTFASLAIYSQYESLRADGHAANWLFAAGIAVAALSYLGSAFWLYEAKRAGIGTLVVVGAIAFGAAVGMLSRTGAEPTTKHSLVASVEPAFIADAASSGMLMGTVLTAMFLGHWYLNSPGMRLEPLKRLVAMIGVALLFRAAVSGYGLMSESALTSLSSTTSLFIAFRWLAGIGGTLIMAAMTWYTLKIPNTQSATGILYAGVIVSFLGELTSQLLSRSSHYPL